MSKGSKAGVGYSQFVCIGSGFSAIALGATLKRWYGITDVVFFERNSDLGGTWLANQYPGSACDVPSVLYSLSFAQNPNWSRPLASFSEMWEYLNRVAEEYDLRSKMVFNAPVKKCQWLEETQRWRVLAHDASTGQTFIHECQFLFAGAGLLANPRKPDLPGIGNFSGPVFHSAQWRHDVSLEDKNVVLVGNGCTASQIFPAIQDQTRHLTQFARSKHWIVPPNDVPNGRVINALLRWVPGLQAAFRFVVFLIMENEFRGFFNTRPGISFRKDRREQAAKFMKRLAPAKYHDMLIPEFEFGCKRRIFDSGYLESLHADNVTLTDEPIVEVFPNGVRTANGFTRADVIVLATGFEMNSVLATTEVIGRDGVTLKGHWKAQGGPSAYNSTCMNGFPNFFLIFGPNAATGHNSAVMAIENCVNFALRLIQPILEGRATVVELNPEAEAEERKTIQEALGGTVYATGCGSWYIQGGDEGKVRHNGTMYPFGQAYFWYRCLFPAYRDFTYENFKRKSVVGRVFRGLLWAGGVATVGTLVLGRRVGSRWDLEQYLAFLRIQAQHVQKMIG